MRAIGVAGALVLVIAAVGAGGGCRQILGIDDRVVAEKPPVDLPTDAEIAAATPIAEADCAAMEACVPLSFRTMFADHADCVKEGAVFWAAHFFGPDSGATTESVAACAAEVPAVTVVDGVAHACDVWAGFNLAAGPAGCSRLRVSTCDFFAEWTPGPDLPDCFPHGAREIGAACGSGAQCSTGLCSFGQQPGEPCGTCVGAAGLGKKCGPGGSDAWCDVGQGCFFVTCIPMATEAFDGCATQDCAPEGVCFAGSCKPLKKAGAEGCQETTATTPTSATCDMDLVCNSADAPAQCEAPTEAPLGGRCGNLEKAGGPVAVCARGARCKLPASGGSPTCVPAVPLGAPCTTATIFGDACEYPGVCLGGICEPRGPRACPSSAL